MGQIFIFNVYQISCKGVNLFTGHPVPGSEDNIIENNQKELETRRTRNNCAVYLKVAMEKAMEI